MENFEVMVYSRRIPGYYEVVEVQAAGVGMARITARQQVMEKRGLTAKQVPLPPVSAVASPGTYLAPGA